MTVRSRRNPGPGLSLRAGVVPVGSLALFGFMVWLVLATAGPTLGYDFECYAGAARQLGHGHLYDVAFSVDVGTCPGTYTYPPPFLLLVAPLLALPDGWAPGIWSLAMAAAFLAGVALLPVRRDVRWLIVIVGALDWSLLYSVKLGQVGPLLFLLFAAAWRWLERPAVVAASAAVGALVKVQPALLVLWAATTGRIRTAVLAVVFGVGLAGAALVVTGVDAWSSYVDLLGRMSGTLGTAHNVAPGGVAIHAGLSTAAASAIQLASAAIAVVALLIAWRWTPAVASFQATLVASQLIASPLRDHYAVLLLLPTAWLVERRRTWAVLIPLAGWASLPAISTPSAWPAAMTVPLAFFVCLAAVVAEGLLERRGGAVPATTMAAASAG